jgi:hypothetical protein
MVEKFRCRELTVLYPLDGLRWYRGSFWGLRCGLCGAEWKDGNAPTCACPPHTVIGFGYDAVLKTWRGVLRSEAANFNF